MKKFGEVFQTADWKKEKHVPLIECADSVKSGEKLDIKVTIGKEVSHPNTTEHHISWIQVYFHPKDGKFTHQLANCEFTGHGEAVEGPNKGPAYTDHSATITVMLNQPGTIYALSLCNIHGLWENSKEIAVQ
jgi:superoxide reductase